MWVVGEERGGGVVRRCLVGGVWRDPKPELATLPKKKLAPVYINAHSYSYVCVWKYVCTYVCTNLCTYVSLRTAYLSASEHSAIVL